MTTPGESIRSLRYALACALAAAGGRVAEALAELDRALDEPGDGPPAARIQLTAGEMLESSDPARALARYVAALDGPVMDEAVTRAQALLDRRAEPASLISSLTAHAVGTAHAVALESGTPDVSLLASHLLRHHGRDEEALAVLRQAHVAARPPRLDLSVQMGETLLDLDRSQEVLDLVDREDPDKRDRSLQLLHAEAHLVRGEAQPALIVAERLIAMGEAAPAVAAVKALSLMALGRLEEAFECLPEDRAPEILLARVVLQLAGREYGQAREASWHLLRMRPTDPDSLLINAQSVVEALDEPDEDEAESSAARSQPGEGPGAEIDAARRLLSEVAAELRALGPASRWWRAQEALRRSDGRFQFFSCELGFAMEDPPSLEELDAVDIFQTTFLQDAALAERKAALLDEADDRDGAAAAHESARATLASIDPVRAAYRARDAYERQSSAERAVQFADDALAAAYADGVDEHESTALMDSAIAAIGPAVDLADDDEFHQLVYLGGWLRGRRTELVPLPAGESSAALLAWLFAALAMRPDDGMLRALAASHLSELGYHAGAFSWARDAFEARPDSVFVVETAVVEAANYHEDLGKVLPFLERHAELSGEQEWRNTVELSVCQSGGDREAMRERVGRTLTDAAWARRTAALATALLHGIPAARDDLEAALDLLAAGTAPSDRLDSVLLAAILQREDRVEELVAVLDDDPQIWDSSRTWARLVQRFAFDATLTPDAFFREALALVDTPNEIHELASGKLPLLAAARSGASGPVEAVPVDRELLETRLAQAEAALTGWFETVAEGPGFGALARLADTTTTLATCAAAAAALEGDLPSPDLVPLERRIGRLVTARAADALLEPLLASVLGRADPPDPEDVRVALGDRLDLPAPTRLAVALLADPSEPDAHAWLARGFSADDAHHAGRLLLERLTATGVDAASWWRLDDILAARADSVPAAAGTIATVRDELLEALREVAGFHTDMPPHDERRPLTLVLGPDFIPADPRSDWRLFTEMLPAMRERVLEATGYEPASVTVIPDREHGDGMRLLVYGAPLEAARIPASPSDPLERAVHHLERFVREHLGDVVSVVDVSNHASLLGIDVRERVMSDASAMVRWLELLRASIERGEMDEPTAAARRIEAQALPEPPPERSAETAAAEADVHA